MIGIVLTENAKESEEMGYYVPNKVKPICYNCPYRTNKYCGLLMEYDYLGDYPKSYEPYPYCPLVEVADRKTENSSEKPNNCETCEHYKLTCDLFSEICKYEPKDNSTISKMEQVDKDINVRSKTMLDCYKCRRYADPTEPCVECRYEPKDEPQTCSVNGRPYSDCSSCEHFRCTADKPQYRSE